MTGADATATGPAGGLGSGRGTGGPDSGAGAAGRLSAPAVEDSRPPATPGPPPAGPWRPSRPAAGAEAAGDLRRAVTAALLKKRAEYRRYWLDFAVGLAIKCIFFLGALYAAPAADPRETAVRVFGFSLWYLSAHVVAKLGNMALEEAYQGTAEQLLVTRTRPGQLLAGVVVAETLLSALWVGLFLAVATVLAGPERLWSGAAAVAGRALVFGLAGLLGMIGMGLVLLGLSLRFKQVGALTEVVLYYLLVFSGFFLPGDTLPWALHLLNQLSPLARAVDGVRAGWSTAAAAGLVSAGWLVAGCAVLYSQWQWARRAGRLGSYV